MTTPLWTKNISILYEKKYLFEVINLTHKKREIVEATEEYSVYDRKTKQEAVLPLEVRDGYLYYEIERTHRLGKWPDDLKDTSAINKIANNFKPFTKYEAFVQGGLIKK